MYFIITVKKEEYNQQRVRVWEIGSVVMSEIKISDICSVYLDFNELVIINFQSPINGQFILKPGHNNIANIFANKDLSKIFNGTANIHFFLPSRNRLEKNFCVLFEFDRSSFSGII